MMKSLEIILTVVSLVLSVQCGKSDNTVAPAAEMETLALVNGSLVDGTGAARIPDAAVVIDKGGIVAAGPRAGVTIPPGARTVDVRGGTILPGFINAHVHDGFEAGNLQTWAQAGVTTVRDMEILSPAPSMAELSARMALRRTSLSEPGNARLVSTGYMITVPGGYGRTYITTPDEARNRVRELLSQGADVIKLSLETGYAGVSNMPLLTRAEIDAVVAEAHAQGKWVTCHITQAGYLQELVEAGVNDAGHMPYDYIPDELIQHMVADGFIIVPTLTVLEAFGVLSGTSDNLRRFVAAGGQAALGNDYTNVPQNGFNHFDPGMPMHEITRMSEAGMTPMQIVVAATRNGARVCGLERDLGTVEAGKIADILVVNGDPLRDLSSLTRVRLVVHDGIIIRSAEN
jgi:imidazolonepropionase-like amidohydrolase